MLRHQFNDPIDEYAQFCADMPVRRKREVHRHRVETPVFEQWHDFATRGELGPHPCTRCISIAPDNVSAAIVI
jgi:hypothetical protein